MAGVAQAYQHPLTIDCLLLSDLPGVSPCALQSYSLVKCGLFSLLQFNCPSFNDQDNNFTIQHSGLVSLLLLGKQIYISIEYTIVTLSNVTIDLFSAIIGLKHQHLECEKHMHRWRVFVQSCQRRIKAAIQIFERLQTTTYIKFDLLQNRSQIAY